MEGTSFNLPVCLATQLSIQYNITVVVVVVVAVVVVLWMGIGNRKEGRGRKEKKGIRAKETACFARVCSLVGECR